MSRKWRDDFETTALTSAHSVKQWQRLPNLMAATLPLAARSTRGFLGEGCTSMSSLSLFPFSMALFEIPNRSGNWRIEEDDG